MNDDTSETGARALDLPLHLDPPDLASYLRIEERELDAGGLN